MENPNSSNKYFSWFLISLPLAAIIFMWIVEKPHVFDDLTFRVPVFTKFPALESQWLYLSVNALTIIFPLLLSFDKKVAFFRTWKFLFPAILLTMVVFIPWDIHFTAISVWGFNPDYYYAPLRILGLPLGEWLFFVTVPYACVFIYECYRCYFDKAFFSDEMERKFTWTLVILLLVFGTLNFGRMYTATTFFLTASFLIFHLMVIRSSYRRRFYVAFLISLVPFLLVNGVLTGGYTESPLVCYNDAENLGIRLVSIPLDDIVYSFLLLFMATTWYEYFRRPKKSKKIII